MQGIPDYWYCDNCWVGWVGKTSKADYGETYYKGKSTIASLIFAPIGNFFYRIRRVYAGNKKKDVWIDVGAGDGGFLRTVGASRRIGVEVSASGRKIMEQNGLETLSDKQFLKAKGLNADIISFWHVLEHVGNPWDYLKAAKNNLRKGGKIIIGVPNIASFEFTLAREYWFHLQPKFHIWYFTPRSIKKLLKKEGYKIEMIDHWSLEHHLTGVLQSFINKTSNSKENVLHKLIKRGTGKNSIKPKDLFWSLFWTTIGFPVVFSFWLAGSFFRRAGTIVVVASYS